MNLLSMSGFLDDPSLGFIGLEWDGLDEVFFVNCFGFATNKHVEFLCGHIVFVVVDNALRPQNSTWYD